MLSLVFVTYGLVWDSVFVYDVVEAAGLRVGVQMVGGCSLSQDCLE